jgi:hypothetical protein
MGAWKAWAWMLLHGRLNGKWLSELLTMPICRKQRLLLTVWRMHGSRPRGCHHHRACEGRRTQHFRSCSGHNRGHVHHRSHYRCTRSSHFNCRRLWHSRLTRCRAAPSPAGQTPNAPRRARPRVASHLCRRAPPSVGDHLCRAIGGKCLRMRSPLPLLLQPCRRQTFQQCALHCRRARRRHHRAHRRRRRRRAHCRRRARHRRHTHHRHSCARRHHCARRRHRTRCRRCTRRHRSSHQPHHRYRRRGQISSGTYGSLLLLRGRIPMVLRCRSC